jgi:hypothetical protein
MKSLATMIAAILALLVQGGIAGAQASSTGTSGHCTNMTVTDYISSYAKDTTTSNAWQNVTDGNLNFTTSATGCVMITFTGVVEAESGTTSYEFALLRTLMDGNNLCVPAPSSTTFFAAVSPSPYTANTIIHICKNVAAGTHNVQVQYRSDFGGDVEINGHVLTITHN